MAATSRCRCAAKPRATPPNPALSRRDAARRDGGMLPFCSLALPWADRAFVPRGNEGVERKCPANGCSSLTPRSGPCRQQTRLFRSCPVQPSMSACWHSYQGFVGGRSNEKKREAKKQHPPGGGSRSFPVSSPSERKTGQEQMPRKGTRCRSWLFDSVPLRLRLAAYSAAICNPRPGFSPRLTFVSYAAI
jgi:hypothetical protein